MNFSYSRPRPRLLVTGSRGRLAVHAIPELAKEYELLLTDKAPPAGDEFNYVQADLTDFAQVLPLVEGVDAIAHLAIASFREFGIQEPPPDRILPFDEMTLRVNVNGTFHLFEAARRAGIKKIVYASSLTAHLGNKSRPVYDPATPIDPLNLYACTKIFGENLGRVFSRDCEASVICLRIGQPYPLFNELDDLWKNSRRARSSFVTVEDVTRSIACALRSGVRYGVYDIVSASDNQRVDLLHAREIGYTPIGYFSDSGLAFYEGGNFPSDTRLVVTDAPLPPAKK